MKKIQLFLSFLLFFLLISCRTTRIVYSIEAIHPSMHEDSIDVNLIKASTVSSGVKLLHISLYLAILNNKESAIWIERSSKLDLLTDSAQIKCELRPDSLSYLMNPKEKKLLQLHFSAMDHEGIVYGSFFKGEKHRLKLSLFLRDENARKIEKQIHLIATGSRKLRPEEPPF